MQRFYPKALRSAGKTGSLGKPELSSRNMAGAMAACLQTVDFDGSVYELVDFVEYNKLLLRNQE